MNLIGFCIKRPVTTIMFFAALMLLGIFSGMQMSIDLMPDISYPTISVSTSYEGAGPEEIEQLITKPIEQAVATVNGIKTITSNSQEGSSRVTLNFEWGVDLDETINDIRSKIDRVKRRLPDDADTPNIMKYDPSGMPVMEIGFSSDVLEESVMLDLIEEDISYLLQKVDGVASAEVRGGRGREIKINVKQARLEAMGLTATQIASAISKENVNEAAGNLELSKGDYLLRTRGEFNSVAEIANLPVTYRNGTPIYVRDVADVEDGQETVRQIVRIDGIPGVILSVQKRSGSNTVNIANDLYKEIEEVKRQYPNLKIRVLNDGSTYIRQSINGVLDSAVFGGILAAIVLFIFLCSFRATLMTAIVMPISILITLMIAGFTGLTLNTISLGGLALGVGMLVDNSVVVLDNIFRKLENREKSLAEAALEGTQEMGPAIAASTLTTLCVFFPLIFLSGQTGIIFKELAYMVIFSLICSLLVAVTLMPMLCSKFLGHQDEEKILNHPLKGIFYRKQLEWEKSYAGLLETCLRHKKSILLISLIIFVCSLALWPFIGTEMIQNSDEGIITVRLTLPSGTKLEETNEMALEMEERFKQMIPELSNLEASVGGNSVGRATFTIRLCDISERERSTQDIVEELQEKILIPGAKVRINARNSMRMLYSGNSDNNSISIDVRGYDQEISKEIAKMIEQRISGIPGIVNISQAREEEEPEYGLKIDRKRAADMGITVSDISSAVQVAVEGKKAGTFRQGGEETDIRVKIAESNLQSLKDLGKVLVASNSGTTQLSNLVEIIPGEGLVSITRKDQERYMTVNAGISGRDLGSVMQDIQSEINKINLPQGITISYGGDYETQQESFKELLFVLCLALLLVYMVMASQFESYLDPFIIMLLIPFALIGVIITLVLTGTHFSNQAYIGLIFLGGVVVNNSIVLISYIRILLARGMDLYDAVVKGASSRLRPILITTITTILGLLPLALGLDEGSKTQAPMARTIIGGLLASTIINLILVPIIMILVEGFVRKMHSDNGFKKKKKGWHSSLCILLVLGMLFTAMPQTTLAETTSNTQAIRELTLVEAVELALQNSESGKIIEARRVAAEADYNQTIGSKKIQVEANVESSFEIGEDAQTELQVEAEKNVPLVNLFGKDSWQDKINTSNYLVSRLGIDSDIQSLIYEVVNLFRTEMLAAKNLQIAQESYDWSVRFKDEVAIRSKLGLTTIMDEDGAEAKEATARATLSRAGYQYKIAQNKLRDFLGIATTEQLTLKLNEVVATDGELEKLIQTALENRPDLKRVSEEKYQAECLLKLAQIAARLGISLNWIYETEDYETTVGLGNLNSNNNVGEWKATAGAVGFHTLDGTDLREGKIYPDDGTVRLKLSWKLFDGKIRRESIREAEAVLTRTTETLSKADKELRTEVEEAYYNYLAQIDVLTGAKLQLKYNQSKLQATEAKLRAGLVSVTDVLDDQLLLNDAEYDLNDAESKFFLYRVKLWQVIGKLDIESFQK